MAADTVNQVILINFFDYNWRQSQGQSIQHS